MISIVYFQIINVGDNSKYFCDHITKINTNNLDEYWVATF